MLPTIERISKQLDNLTELVLRSEGWVRSPGHFGWYNTKTGRVASDIIMPEDLLQLLRSHPDAE